MQLTLKEIFPGISRELREKLESVGDYRAFHNGAVLYEEGFPCTMVPFILSGVIRVFKIGETGREITLYRVEAGQICILSSSCALGGEDAQVPAVAMAETDVEMLGVPTHVYRRLLLENIEMQSMVNQMLTERLTEMMMVLDEVAFGRVDLRLADRLAKAATERGAMVETTHAKLATELGSAREVISRVLKDFERRGLVILHRGRVEVAQVDRLADLSLQRSH